MGLLGEQVASRETEEGSTFRVCHAHLATANPALKVGSTGAWRGGGGWADSLPPLQRGSPVQRRSTPCPCMPPVPQAMHARLQPLLYFFVDAASTIDQEDEGWHLLTAVEQSPEGVEVRRGSSRSALPHRSAAD